jgi:hypothetical protein
MTNPLPLLNLFYSDSLGKTTLNRTRKKAPAIRPGLLTPEIIQISNLKFPI